MKKFNINNLNNIKDICNEQIGIELPHKEPIKKSRLAVIVVVFLACLMPLTAYAAKYTLSYIEYSTSEKNVKQEAEEFVSDFIKYSYGKDSNYLVDKTYEESFEEYLKQTALCFMNDTYQRKIYDVGYYWYYDYDSKILNVKNNGSAWYIEIETDITERKYNKILNTYSITFFLKYEGYMSTFKLTDMYFHSSKSYGEDIFGELGTVEGSLDIDQFIRFADELSDYRYYAGKASAKTKEVSEFLDAKAVAAKIVNDYLSYTFGGEDRFAGKFGPAYDYLEALKEYVNYRNDSIYNGEYSVNISQLKKINGYWYAAADIIRYSENADGEPERSGLDSVMLKFTEFEGDYTIEDIYLSGISTGGFMHVKVDEHLYTSLSFEKFIDWADETDNYDEYIEKINDFICRRTDEDLITEKTEAFVDSFISVVYGKTENPWKNGKAGSVEEFLGVSADYFKISAAEEYEMELLSVYGSKVDTARYRGEAVISLKITDENGKIIDTPLMKFFLMYKKVLGEFVLEDVYYFGNFYQCHNVFEKVGKNNFSLTDTTFIDWAERTEEYSYYTQRVKTAMESFKSGKKLLDDAPVDPYK